MAGATEIRDDIRAFLADRCHIAAAEIDGDTRLEQDLGLDSFDLVALLIEVEESYGVVVADAEAGHLETLDDAVAFIQAHRGRDA